MRLQADITYVESDAGFGIALAERLKDRKNGYSNMRTNNFPLPTTPWILTSSPLTILSRYKHRKEFSWLNEFIPLMEHSFELVSNGQNSAISYQENIDLKGTEWIGVLFNLIVKKKQKRKSQHQH